jgi:hypothetical protein
MRVVFNDIIPFKGFLAVTIWPFVFVRNSASGGYNAVTDHHEQIHGRQQKEMLAVGCVLAAVSFLLVGWWSLLCVPLFFWWYGIEWVVRLIQYRNGHAAYRNISFEREAFEHQRHFGYLTGRKWFAWIGFLKE